MRDDLDIIAEPHVRLADVTVRAQDTTILDRMSLTVATGRPTALIGPNGSGKTTLLRTIMGLTEPASGTVDLAPGARAIVFQKPVMLRRSAAENVGFALAAAGHARQRRHNPSARSGRPRRFGRSARASLVGRRAAKAGHRPRLGVPAAIAVAR